MSSLLPPIAWTSSSNSRISSERSSMVSGSDIGGVDLYVMERIATVEAEYVGRRAAARKAPARESMASCAGVRQEVSDGAETRRVQLQVRWDGALKAGSERRSVRPTFRVVRDRWGVGSWRRSCDWRGTGAGGVEAWASAGDRWTGADCIGRREPAARPPSEFTEAQPRPSPPSNPTVPAQDPGTALGTRDSPRGQGRAPDVASETLVCPRAPTRRAEILGTGGRASAMRAMCAFYATETQRRSVCAKIRGE